MVHECDALMLVDPFRSGRYALAAGGNTASAMRPPSLPTDRGAKRKHGCEMGGGMSEAPSGSVARMRLV